MRQLLDPLKNTLLHPQWLSLRFHRLSRRCLLEIENCVVLDIGSGDSEHAELLHPSCILYRIDYPTTNARYRLARDIFADATAISIATERVERIRIRYD